MTFNVRFDSVDDARAGHGWADRMASVAETIAAYSPDVVGFQEVRRSQLRDLTDMLNGYLGVGKPREIGETAEYVPIFFRVERFDCEDHGDFWLSPTPEVEGSRGWDTDAPRHCTWVKLSDKTAARRFAVFNTHLDVWGSVARFEAAKLIVNRVALAPGDPAVVMGDLNAEEDSDVVDTFRTAGFRDTFRDIHPDAEDVQTVHLYTELSGRKKIDYVMCDSRWRVLDAFMIRDRAAGRLPSDHFPVVAELDLRTDGPAVPADAVAKMRQNVPEQR